MTQIGVWAINEEDNEHHEVEAYRPAANRGGKVEARAHAVRGTKSDQTSMTETNMHDIDKINIELNLLMLENGSLKKELDAYKYSLDSFINNDKVKHFTGLPAYSVLKLIFDFLSDAIDEHVSNKLTKFQKLLIVLMRLRLNVSVCFFRGNL